MVRFTGSITNDYKDLIIRALTGSGRPSWLYVACVRTNSNGHTLRLTGKVTGPEAAQIARALAKQNGKPIVCGDGVVYLTSYSNVL